MVLVTRVVYEVDARLGKACQINSTGATIDQELVGMLVADTSFEGVRFLFDWIYICEHQIWENRWNICSCIGYTQRYIAWTNFNVKLYLFIYLFILESGI